jgi:hypothetical protein
VCVCNVSQIIDDLYDRTRVDWLGIYHVHSLPALYETEIAHASCVSLLQATESHVTAFLVQLLCV